MAISDSYWWIRMLRAQADQLADQVAHLPTRKWQFEIHTDRFPARELRQIKWQIYPSRKWIFEIHTDSFLLWDLRQTSWQIKWQIYPLRKWQFQIHTDRFLLWELRQTRWQIKWQIYPLRKWQFQIHTDIFLPRELRHIKWQISPLENGNLRFILIDSYSDSSGRTCRRLPPQKMVIWDSDW